MRTKVKLKGGISLIVLVITIIVMIILAAAIILSLSNSGIIGKANKAKTDSDTANLKEYVNTLRAEWELMTDAEQTAEGSFVDYANSKLAEKGYKRELAADGETVMNENATAAVKAGIKVGDVVTGYTVTEKSYTTSGEENTAPSRTETDPTKQTLTTNTDITWKYLGVNANGELEIMAVLSEKDAITDTADKQLKVKLSGKGGYLKGPDMLNTICEKLYSKDGLGTARSINIDDVNNILGYTGPKGWYVDNNNNGVATSTPVTIETIENSLGKNMYLRATPDGKDLKTYYADGYTYYNSDDNIKNTANKELVYNSKNEYWLASPCVYAWFSRGNAFFEIRFVNSNTVNRCYVFSSDNMSFENTHALRPVVTLNSNVKLTPNADKTEWAIS